MTSHRHNPLVVYLAILVAGCGCGTQQAIEAFQLPRISPVRVSHGYGTVLYANENNAVPVSVPEPLVVDGDWAAYVDTEGTGLVYYFNGKTDESLWEKPYPSFPDVKRPNEQQQQQQQQPMFSFGLFGKSSNDDSVAVVEEVVEQSKEQNGENNIKKGSLFGGFFGSGSTSDVIDEKKTTVGASTESISSNDDNETASSTGNPMFINMFKQQSSSVKEPTPVVENSESKKKETASNIDGGNSMFMNMFKQQPSSIKESASVVEKSEPVKKETLKKKESAPSDKIAPVVSSPVPAPVRVEPRPKETVGLEISTRVVPHPEKVSWGGEDAIFSEGRTFGVFDGVSGAEKEEGKDLYSRTLAKQFELRCNSGGKSMKELMDILKEVSELADIQATGASTALVANVAEDNTLRVLNVGDCRLIVIRDGIITARTKDIVHYFDCPYQLSVDSPDKPKDGTKLQLELMKGDIMVAGSDGIFDNLSESRICKIVNRNLWPSPSSSGIPKIVKMIVDEARKISFDPEIETPYSVAAKRYYENYSDGLGGKLDDISCIVARCT